MALALALHKQGVSAEIFEARERGAGLKDRRILALSHGSQQTLEWLGAWRGIDATPIHHIHVSQRGRAGRTMIHAEDEGVPALGYVASLQEIHKALDKAISADGITYHDNARIDNVMADTTQVSFNAADETRRTQLIVHASGAIDADSSSKEDIRAREYDQHAVTAVVTLRDAPKNTAWERFTPKGPLALLPFGDAFALVQTCTPQAATELTTISAAEFLSQLQIHFGQRLQFIGCGPRYAFPLGLRYRHSSIAERQVWVGNAAQTLHPVAGQGFNLALRDVRELASVLSTVDDPGSNETLKRYARRRQADRRSVIGFTDLLVRAFSNDNPMIAHPRGVALTVLDLLPVARSFVARRMMFGARAWS